MKRALTSWLLIAAWFASVLGTMPAAAAQIVVTPSAIARIMRVSTPAAAAPAVPGDLLTAITSGGGCAGCPAASPDLRLSAKFSIVTTSGGRVATITDLAGTQNAAAGTELNWHGPLYGTDGLGRPYMRFNTNEYLAGGAGFTVAANQTRALTVCMVGRMHRSYTSAIFGLGSHELTAGINTNGVAFGTLISASIAPHFKLSNVTSSGAASNAEKMIAGSQMSVICVKGTGTGVTFDVDGDNATVASAPSVHALGTGYEVGRYPNSVGTADTHTPQQSGPSAAMDVYEIAVWKSSLTDGQVTAVAQAYGANWSIGPPTNQLVLDGDSITQGVQIAGTSDPVYSGDSLGMQLTNPGSAIALPSSWRVVNIGVSGAKIADLVTRRDATNAVFNFKLSGANVVAFQIGANDVSVPTTGANMYAAIVPVIHTTTTGYLERGWTVRPEINIAQGNVGNQTEIANLRTLMRNISQFRTDTGGTSSTLINIDLAAIQIGALTPFSASGDISTTYYQTKLSDGTLVDSLHPNPTGTALFASGGDTPANGVSYGVQH